VTVENLADAFCYGLPKLWVLFAHGRIEKCVRRIGRDLRGIIMGQQGTRLFRKCASTVWVGFDLNCSDEYASE